MTSRTALITAGATLAALATVPALIAQAPVQAAPHGTVERIKVHGKALEGNLEGDSPDRDVSIYLPPSYSSGTRRYPVIYLLHGYTDNDDRWFGRIQHFISVPQVVDKALAGGSREMIVVMPNAYTRYQGSMYSNSVTTGDWETYIARDLVAYVDAHYRTMANVASRGLAGHSMGGYGTMRIGMKYPTVFSSIYALSPCCMVPNLNPPQDAGPSRAEAIRTMEEFEKADFGTKAQIASAAAWSPDPKSPPFFFDLPTREGQPQPLVLAKWAANAPLAMVDQYIGNLRALRGVGFDAGDKDVAIANTTRTLDAMLNAYGLPHSFEIYDGNHVNHVAERVETKMLPFFSTHLSGDPAAATRRSRDGSAVSPAERTPSPALDAAALSRPLSAAVERGDVPGVTAVVVDRDRVLYEGAFGKLDVAHGVKMPADAIFRIASMTKPMTSVAIMMLAEEGKLHLDDPVSKYLPGFDHLQVITSFNPSDGTYQTRPARRTMTLRHLLTHTSGIGYAFSSPIVARLQQGNQKSEWEFPLLHDPGDKWTYGASTRVLGLVVEKITGKPLDAFFRDRIFGPLGMKQTAFVVPEDHVGRVATVHRRMDGKLVEQPNSPTQLSPVRGDGGLYSTARDYSIFLQMLLNGGALNGARLLSEKSVSAMGANQIGSVVVSEQPAADPARTRPFPLGAGKDKFGLGFQIAVRDDRFAAFRSPGSLSWAGIDNTHFWIDPARRVAAVVLMQVLPFYDEAAIRTLRDFEREVYRQLK